jgi:propionate CoA-transferase
MSFGEAHNPAYLGDGGAVSRDETVRGPLDISRIIQRRAFLELRKAPGAIINLGIGIPSGLAATAAQSGYSDFQLTIESGVIGGVAAEELSFGAASNPEAVIDQAAQFDFYSGGGLDVGFLGMLQVDVEGNVNVERLKDQIIGAGGFIDIAQNAKAVCFLGAFTAGGLRVAASGGRLSIVREGAVRKFVERVDRKSFSAAYALRCGRRVRYITERAVFALTEIGLQLVEIAPGIDLRREVLDLLPPGVEVAGEPALMDRRIFEEATGLEA